MAFAIARSFCHWTFLLLDVYSPWHGGCYLLFPLLDISCCWLLLNVSFTRRIHGKALLAILLNVSIARHFSYLLDVSAPPFLSNLEWPISLYTVSTNPETF